MEHTELLVERSQLDGLGELAMSPPERLKSAARGVVSYALGVDEEARRPSFWTSSNIYLIDLNHNIYIHI